MIKALKCDLSKTTAGAGFILSVIMTALLCWLGDAYTDIETAKSYSVIEALISPSVDINSDIEMCSEKIYNGALSGYSSMALPVTAAFPFVFAFVLERKSRNIRLVSFRCGRIKYYVSKFITALLCGGLCTALGLIIFGLTETIFFSSAASFPAEINLLYFPNGTGYVLLAKTISAFLYGMKNAALAFFLCSFCGNAYVVLCVPFLLDFIAEVVLKRIAADSSNFEIYEILAPFQPNSISTIFNYGINKTSVFITAFNLIYISACFAGFVCVMEKRTDKGE